jgi:cytochrome c biogenesis factor
MAKAIVGFFLLAQSIMIYFAIVFITGIFMGPELIRHSGTKGLVIVGIVTLIIQGILIKAFTTPDELTEEDFEELE